MSKRPKFGYLVPTRDAVMRAPDGRADIHRMVDLGVLSERIGFDSIWVGDSVLARPRFEALTTLAAIATRTSRAQLGTAVYITPLRHPVPLAQAVANVDLLSDGRLLFGIGIGPGSPAVEAEYVACGIDFHKRGLLLEEGLQIMKGLWTGQPYSFKGRLFELNNARMHPLPSRDGGPLVLMAAAADRALTRLARFADGWLPISPDPASFSADWKKITAACKEVKRDHNKLLRVLYTTLNVNADEATAAREMDEFLVSYYGAQQKLVIEQYQGHCAGGPERCAAFLKGFVEAGATHFVVRFAAASQEPQMERFLKDVVPLLS
jgi:alkanesulfonate monooxygenase SsuD/methylene tetrahydromethanopterin reductase-like flavin-dependent oxidoreductase (luciferase family)